MIDGLILLKALVAFSPVLILVAASEWLDAFKLVSLREIALLLLGGAVLALISYAVNGRFLDAFPIGFSPFSRTIAPLIEEGLKSALIFWLFYRNRIGFSIDAAIVGVAVGAGFSVAENLIYLGVFAHASVGVWVVRGFGTALMHAGSSAIFAVMGQHLTQRFARIEAQRHRLEVVYFLPGLALAIALHAAFNQFAPEPVIAMALTLFVVPLALFLMFSRSEHAAHKWLLTDYASHKHMLDDIRQGKLVDSPAGRFVQALADQFPPSVGEDMFRYIQVHTWLVAKAEEDLIDAEEGRAEDLGREVREKLHELHALERVIGPAALMAMSPHLHFTRNDLWEIHELEEHANGQSHRERRAVRRRPRTT
ncbi:MAG TPA: PrsW family glutamic-type intramembrane protease [Caulobacteraceae bacterium]|nr:PrsW family glutamic-type intramembrane protease [Caulobacteraceae bacterium]